MIAVLWHPVTYSQESWNGNTNKFLLPKLIFRGNRKFNIYKSISANVTSPTAKFTSEWLWKGRRLATGGLWYLTDCEQVGIIELTQNKSNWRGKVRGFDALKLYYISLYIYVYIWRWVNCFLHVTGYIISKYCRIGDLKQRHLAPNFVKYWVDTEKFWKDRL